jgi:eukaryotic-like serine/threonine-protein kinase
MNDADRELIGRTLGGRFRLTGYIGSGAMASVFRGEQEADPRDVAVKVMHAGLLRDATFAKRFAREAKTAASIEHRNTVRIVDFGSDGELVYLAMGLCVGENLVDLLVRERRLPEARAARIGIQICAVLSAAHRQGVVHRDLKPENVMICKDPGDPAADLVKVLDFGIAKSFERERRPRDDAPPSSGEPMSAPPSSVLTMVGGLVGTPEYMSPEQSLGMPVDARSDLYAAGAVLFQLVAGRPPFTGNSAVDVLMQQTDKPPPRPSAFTPGLHAGLERVILRALAKLPENRFQSAAELSEALAAILPELATEVRRESLQPTSPSVPPRSAPTLPGVPSAVAITSDEGPRVSPIPADRPPDTLRSTTQAATAEEPPPPVQVVPAQVSARITKAEAFLSTLAEGDVLPMAAEPTPPPPAAATAATPPPPAAAPSRPAPTRAPAPLAPAAAGHALVPSWFFAVVTTILVAILVLVRYLRFR